MLVVVTAELVRVHAQGGCSTKNKDESETGSKTGFLEDDDGQRAREDAVFMCDEDEVPPRKKMRCGPPVLRSPQSPRLTLKHDISSYR
jgi:hypothetical protein